MVSAGRVCCITLPGLLSIAVLACTVIIFIAGTFDKNKTLDDLYFLKIDLSNLTVSDSLVGGLDTNSTAFANALDAARRTLGMDDYYTIYLRSYCHWNGNEQYANCTDPKFYFWFNPIKVWGLNQTGVDVNTFLPTGFHDGLDTYQAASKAISYLYVFALIAAILTVVVGFSAIFSRWGSFATTFCATAMWILMLGASITATAVYAVLREVLNKNLKKDYGIKSELGTRFMYVTWIGTAFAVGAGFFWFLSVCCCSGRSPYNHSGKESRRTKAEKTPYTYERVGSPYLGPTNPQSVPLTNFGPAQQAQRGTAYEPFRPQNV